MSRVSNLRLLDNVSATGAGAWLTWDGGKGSFIADSTGAFAAVQLEMKGPAGTTIVVGPDTTLAAAGGGNFELAPCEIRANIPSGSPVGLTAVAKSTQ
jgi:hypothetical protein